MAYQPSSAPEAAFDLQGWPIPQGWRMSHTSTNNAPALPDRKWPALPASTQTSPTTAAPKKRPNTKTMYDQSLTSLNFGVRLKRPDAARPRWTYDDIERTFDNWREKEEKRDANFKIYVKTTDSTTNKQAVVTRFPTPTASWHQIVLLVALTSNERRIDEDEVTTNVWRISTYWAHPSRRAIMEVAVGEALASGLFVYDDTPSASDWVLGAGEENTILTDRWSKGLLKHFQAPPYHQETRYKRESTSEDKPSSFDDLPNELVIKILNRRAPLLALLVVPTSVLDGKRSPLCELHTQALFVHPERRPNTHNLPLFLPWSGDKRKRVEAFLESTLRLRFVQKRWAPIIKEAFFPNSMMFEHIASAFEVSYDGPIGYRWLRSIEVDGNSVGWWFVPHCGAHDVEKCEAVVRYSVLTGPGSADHYEKPSRDEGLVCTRDELYILPGREGKWSLRSEYYNFMGFYLPDEPELEWLQVLGYLFSAELSDIPRLGNPFNNQLRAFIWALMNKPQDVPTEGEKFTLNLGHWHEADLLEE
ncbi:hypothetical protein CC86DRAFT_432894 [Ophiobolus disseminans]|uniref:Uncharacterized protein n=1 Tax=Ophiobolus disseminans TaxID=1469910 RepID=A0A6A6ZEV5_9PLEO|nr:hypothetical protein CC86DRAFT_432894 [Ophiobolus disseminans]